MAKKPHVLIVEARFYPDIVDEMVAGALAKLGDVGASKERLEVPGAFEIPAAISIAANARNREGHLRYDAFIALGCVIRGETSHYDYVCTESARGIMDLSIHRGLAIGYGILTVENSQQAMVRAAVNNKNKGGDAVMAALRILQIKKGYETVV